MNMNSEQFVESDLDRTSALNALNIIDSNNDPAFDNLCQIIASYFDVPIVAISLVDENRCWFKSTLGIQIKECRREDSFCNLVVTQNAMVEIVNIHHDERFIANPILKQDSGVSFYIGVPLHCSQGYAVGSLCLMDYSERSFIARDIQTFKRFAVQAEQLIALHQNKYAQSVPTGSLVTQQYNQSIARHDALLKKAALGIVTINEKGTIETVNSKLIELLGYTEHELIGKNVKMLMPDQMARDHDKYLDNYKRGYTQAKNQQSAVIGEGRELVARHKSGELIPIQLAVSEVISDINETKEFLGIITDLREQKKYERKVLEERTLLSTLNLGITNFNALVSGNQLWEYLQQSLLDLTESNYSLIGMVVPGEDGPALKIHALTDISSNRKNNGQQDVAKYLDEHVTNRSSLLGSVFDKGETVIIEKLNAADHPEDYIAGHEHLSNFLGIPIVENGKVLGMFAVADSAKTINQDLANWLEPFKETCLMLLRFYRMTAENELVMEQLRSAKEEVEAASRAKTEFLSSMSHELRTPLNSIIGFSQLMLSQTKNPLAEKQRKQTEQIHSSGKHLLVLINEILDLAKIEAGKLSVSIEPTNIHSVVTESIETVTPMAKASGIRMTVEIDERFSVLADYTRLKQVMINLLSNAVKYNKDNGSVDVTMEINDVNAEISVRDTGIGISVDKMGEMFEPFNRLGAEDSGIEGTGVGLALTKKLIEYMNGSISVTSSTEGSVFTISIPLVEKSIELLNSNNSDSDQVDMVGGVNKPKGQSEIMSVLYVEDNPANQFLMEEIFEDLESFSLKCIHDPLLGFELAKKMRPDLIILDINLPHISGFELLRMIQSQKDLEGIPVIALSANALPADIAKGIALGFENYLTKPVDIPVFLEILNSYYNNQKETF